MIKIIQTQTFVIEYFYIMQLVILHVGQITLHGNTEFVFLTVKCLLQWDSFFLQFLNI